MDNRRVNGFPKALVVVLGLMALVIARGSEGREDATAQIKEMIAKYAAVVNAEPVDLGLASQVWSSSTDVSLIYPLGEQHGWEQVKRNFYEKTMEALFSQRTLTPRDITVHAYGDSAWAEFSWHFAAKSRKDGSTVQSSGRETQIYRKVGRDRWVLVHVHYSVMRPLVPGSVITPRPTPERGILCPHQYSPFALTRGSGPSARTFNRNPSASIIVAAAVNEDAAHAHPDADLLRPVAVEERGPFPESCGILVHAAMQIALHVA